MAVANITVNIAIKSDALMREMRSALECVCRDFHGGGFPDCDECQDEYPTYFAMRELEQRCAA